MSEILLGLLPSSASAETAINNYSEAGVSTRHISIVMENEATARAIAPDVGPLQGTSPDDVASKLTSFGMSSTEAEIYAFGVKAGQVLIALPVQDESRSEAMEVLRGLNAQQLTVINVE